MESVALDMEDILGAEADFDEAQLPDMETELEPMRAEGRDADDGDDGGQVPDTDDPDLLAKLKSMKGASKNPTTKRTMPKLDATRLTGERGLAMLPQIFEKIPLKGKNHEIEDLKVIMRHLTHWGHRLFPKMPVDEVFDRCEKLGKKREVQTCVKRIRMDMPLLHGNPGYNMDEDDVQRVGNNEEDDVQRVGDHEEDDVHRVGDHQEHQMPRSPDAENFNTEIDDDEIEDLLRDQEEYDRQQEESNLNDKRRKTNVEVEDNEGPNDANKKQDGLSEEVRARIARNKLLAQQRRAQKLGRAQDPKETSRVEDQAVLDDLNKNKSADTEVETEEAYLHKKIQDNNNLSEEKSQKLKDNENDIETDASKTDDLSSSKIVAGSRDIENEKLKNNHQSMEYEGPLEIDL